MSFEAELRHANIQMSEVLRDEVLPRALSRASFNSLEELYAAIGYGGISAQKVVNKIRDDLRAAEKTKKKEDLQPKVEKKEEVKPKHLHGVMVEGLDNCLVKFARCCAPVPGDPVVGFITRGFGVSVHRQDCINYIKSEKTPEETGRWVRVGWADTEGHIYTTTIQIQVRDRTGIVVDVASVLNALHVKISSFNARDAGSGLVFVSVDVNVKNRDELIAAMAKLMSVPGVTDVRRTDG
jgi:GTP pyrophosphokinase